MPESQRRTPRQERSRATVDAILLAAAHILKSDGLEAATTNRIAELAGVSIGSLYQYFADKQAILEALRDRHHDWFDASLRGQITRGSQLPLRQAIRGSVDQLVAMHTVDPALHGALSPEEHALSAAEMSFFREQMKQYLASHPDEVRRVDPDIACVIVTRAMEAIIHGTGRDEPEWLAHPKFREEVTELLVRYLQCD